MMPDSAGSQFFIMHKDAPHLDGAYAAFGKIIEGQDVVDAIAETATDYSDRPLEDQVMKTVVVDTFGEEYPEPEVFKVTPDLRTRINTGIKMASRTEKRLFNETFNSFLHKCDEMGSENTPYQYMETEEYADLKKLILSSSPATCYLLMDRYLKRNPPFFSFILNDLIETAYPNTADKIANRMKSLTTVQETMELFPQVCLEIWLDEIEE